MACGGVYDDILEQEGFRRIGELSFRLHLSVWWQQATKVQLVAMPVGSRVVLKGTKAYYLVAISEEGETWARDIGPLHDYLEAHFPELHLSFSYFRDVTTTIAAQHLRGRVALKAPTVRMPTVEDIARFQQQLAHAQQGLQSSTALLELDSGSSSLAESHLRRESRQLQKTVEHLEEKARKGKEQIELFQHLQRAYERECSAACLVFSLSSNLHVAASPEEFRDPVAGIVKELADAHRYQVAQKLCGGKLNIQVKEATQPEMVWLEEWHGGALSPRQLEQLGPELQLVRDGASKHFMVTPDCDIQIDNHTKDTRKLIAARMVSTLVRRLDRSSASERTDLEDLSEEAKPARIGLVVQGTRVTNTPALLPLVQLQNAYCSGITGSGKSYLARIFAEEAVQFDDLDILVLDPRNQSAGLLIPEDREEILAKYEQFDMQRSEARGFKFQYFSPGQDIGGLPRNLGELAHGRVIVSFKCLDDKERCTRFSEILEAHFRTRAQQESPTLRSLIFVEEAQNFTKKRVTSDAKAAAEAAENALGRLVREGRKYGLGCVIVSQSIKDFAYDAAAIRQNTNTKIFFRNADREVDYAADFLGDGRQIIQLPTATAIVHNAAWGVVKVKVRPPFSKVWEFGTDETRQIVQGAAQPARSISGEAQRLLDVVNDHVRLEGEGLNISRAAEAIGISSKRHISQLVDELEQAGLVQTRKLRQRGQPRLIELISSAGADERRTKAD